MGMYTQFMGNLSASRPLTKDELVEYEDAVNKSGDIYLMFFNGSNNKLEGTSDQKVVGYVDMEKGFLDTLNWMKSKGITLTGRINYVYEDMFTSEIGGGFGAFVVTPEQVTYHKLDFDGLTMVSNVISRAPRF
jgi:hypothetical protein